MKMNLKTSDLKRIGFLTDSDTKGNTRFVCELDTANLEHIFLREILAITEHEIIGEYDYCESGGEIKGIVMQTNFPWEIYWNMKESK